MPAEPPQGPPPPPESGGRPPGRVNPSGEPEQQAPFGRNWGTVLGGAVLGFLSWFFAMVVVVMATYDSTGGTIDGVLLWLLVAVFLCAVGLIVWPRTRRLGQGFLLGFAIGLVVAGGICIPGVLGSA